MRDKEGNMTANPAQALIRRRTKQKQNKWSLGEGIVSFFQFVVCIFILNLKCLYTHVAANNFYHCYVTEDVTDFEVGIYRSN